MKRGVIFIIFILLVNTAYGLNIAQQSCENNGKFSITLEAIDKNKTYTNEIEVKIDNKIMNGLWDINFMQRDPPDRSRQWATFTSDEGQILDGGNKIIKIKYPIGEGTTKTFETIQGILNCPIFIFSCALLNTEINECYTKDNIFYGYFTINGFEQTNIGRLSLENNLEFNLYTEDVYEDIGDKITTKGVRPKKAIVKKYEGDKYVMVFEFPNTNSVTRFRVGLKSVEMCLAEKYDRYHLKLSAVKECGIKEEKIVEPIEEVKEIKEEKIEEKPQTRVIEDAVFEPKKEESDLPFIIILLLVLGVGIIILIKMRKKFSLTKRKK